MPLDTTTNQAAMLPHQAARTALDRPIAPSGCRQTTWHVVATKTRKERIAHAALHHRGYNPYLPLALGKPLFPGYVFLQLSNQQPWYPIQWAPGVYSLLQCNGKPIPCPREAVEAIQAGDEVRSIPTTRNTLWRPGEACEASLGGGYKADAVVVAVAGQKATVLTMMFGQLRPTSIHISHLQHRS